MALHLSQNETLALIGVLGAIGTDTLAGTLVAIVKGTFKLSYIANFIRTSILPYFGGILVVALPAAFVDPSTALGQWANTTLVTVAAAIGLKFLGDIVLKLQSLGLPIETPVAAPKA